MTQPQTRSGAILIGTLRAGSTIHRAPDALKDRGIYFIAVHPDEQPMLVGVNGIKPLHFPVAIQPPPPKS